MQPIGNISLNPLNGQLPLPPVQQPAGHQDLSIDRLDLPKSKGIEVFDRVYLNLNGEFFRKSVLPDLPEPKGRAVPDREYSDQDLADEELSTEELPSDPKRRAMPDFPVRPDQDLAEEELSTEELRSDPKGRAVPDFPVRPDPDEEDQKSKAAVPKKRVKHVSWAPNVVDSTSGVIKKTTKNGVIKKATKIGVIKKATEIGVIKKITEIGVIKKTTKIGVIKKTTKIGVIKMATENNYLYVLIKQFVGIEVTKSIFTNPSKINIKY